MSDPRQKLVGVLNDMHAARYDAGLQAGERVMLLADLRADQDRYVKACGPLSPEEEREIQRGIDRTWGYIASDYLVDDEGNPSNKTISKSEVLEACLDADRLEEHGSPENHGRKSVEWSALCARFYAQPDKVQTRIARAFSTYKRFGR